MSCAKRVARTATSAPTSFQFCWRICAVCSQASLSDEVCSSNLRGAPSFARIPPAPRRQPAASSVASAFALSNARAGLAAESFGHHDVGKTPVELGIDPYLNSTALLMPTMSAAYQSAWRTALSEKILLAGADGSRLYQMRGP